jgi:hypothetical protein
LKRFLTVVCLLAALSSYCQSLEIKLDGSEEGKSLIDVFSQLEKKYPVRFFYLPEWLDQIKFEKSYQGKTLGAALDEVFSGTDINYTTLYDYAIIFSKDPSRALERDRILSDARNEKRKIPVFNFGTKGNGSQGKKVQISGIVKDSKSNEPIGGVNVAISGGGAVTTTPDGKYQFSIPVGEYVISYRYLNYEEYVIELNAFDNGKIDVNIEEIPRLLDEVVITDKSMSNVEGKVGVTSIKIADMKKMPAFLGEVDIIRQIQVLPGVTSVGEVSSGFNVRGGGADQNLIQYDGVTIFNNSHVFGFFSGFSSDAIKDATFLKSGISSEFGGRISSVLNITSKEGSYEKWNAEGGIGLISSHLTVHGPIKKNVSSVMFSARSSYSDWLLKAFTRDYPSVQNSSVGFYDASMKLTHKFSEASKLSFSGYVSHDRFSLPSDTTFAWNNMAGSLKLDHIFNERLQGTFLLSYGQYAYEVTDSDPLTAYKLNYKISYPALKGDIVYDWGRHKTMLGVNSVLYTIQPGSLAPTAPTSGAALINIADEKAFENAFFISDAINLWENLHIDVGIRLSMFSKLGPGLVRNYQPGLPLSESTVVDSVQYGAGKVIKNFIGPEPRFSMTYVLSPQSSIKAGFNRMYQYIHLISNSVAINPIDIWQTSNQFFQPQIGDQVSAGYFQNLNSGMFELSVEGFYKKINNILDFKDGADLVLNPHLETALLSGRGKSYGVEFAANKVRGRLSGSLNYTYSRSLRQVKSSMEGATINGGKIFPSNFDQPHVINLNWKYGLSRRFAFTGNFTYHSGRPITVPVSYAVIDHIPIVTFSERNQYRVPAYHRLDLALVIEGSHRRQKFWDGTWTISLYNAYGRKNVYSVFYKQGSNGLQQAYKLSIIGTVLPSISYRFKISK